MTLYFVFFGIAILVFAALISVMKKIQFHQRIFELSPGTHQAKKNIPTMGGLGLLVCVILATFWTGTGNLQLIWLTTLIGLFALIGLIDDGMSIGKARNKGLSVLQKLALQIGAAAGMVVAYSLWIEPLSIMTGLFYGLIIVGGTNATNLTDGLDGLLAGLSIISALGFLLLFQHNPLFSQWITLLILALLAYWVFNGHPARVFMGDTGSLLLGAAFTGLAILYGNVWVLLPLGAVYIVETLSVILQVASFKWRKKRIFLMAPLHHHFELLGLKETQVVNLFWGVGLVMSWIGLALR